MSWHKVTLDFCDACASARITAFREQASDGITDSDEWRLWHTVAHAEDFVLPRHTCQDRDCDCRCFGAGDCIGDEEDEQ